jgi:hypothetical protein
MPDIICDNCIPAELERMDREQRLYKLKNGSDTAIWAANEIEAIESHAENLAAACAWAVGALPAESFVASQIIKVLKDYNNRNA